MKRVNIGCGQSPVQGWLNYDNSLSVRVARLNVLARIINKLGILNKGQNEFIRFAMDNKITWADATRHIPLRDGSVEVLYCSHMIEHLDRHGAGKFLEEAYRVISPKGVIRIVVPDIRKHVDAYLQHGDADLFLEKLHLARTQNKTLVSRLINLAVGDRNHLWMYDGASLVRLLSATGFKNPVILPPGLTTISDPGELNLREREDESVYVEATR